MKYAYKAEWTRKYETYLSNNYIILISKKIEYFLELLLDFGTKLARKIILISKKKKKIEYLLKRLLDFGTKLVRKIILISKKKSNISWSDYWILGQSWSEKYEFEVAARFFLNLFDVNSLFKISTFFTFKTLTTRKCS